jgi:hypothetical protein
VSDLIADNKEERKKMNKTTKQPGRQDLATGSPNRNL